MSAITMPVTPVEEQKCIMFQFPNKGGNNVKSASVGVSNKTYAIKDENKLKLYISYYNKKKNFSIIDMEKYVLVMFELCVGLRISDIIPRTWDDVIDGDGYREFIRVRQKKTSKYGEFGINPLLQSVLDEYKAALKKYYGEFDSEWYLFPSSKSATGHITRQGAWKWVNEGAAYAGIELNVSNHGLRKTFGYTSMKTHQDDAMFLATLMRLFGHSSERITLAYCGLDEDNNKELYNDVSNYYTDLINK